MTATVRQHVTSLDHILELWDDLSESEKLSILPHLLTRSDEFKNIQAAKDGRTTSTWLMGLFEAAGLDYFPSK